MSLVVGLMRVEQDETGTLPKFGQQGAFVNE